MTEPTKKEIRKTVATLRKMRGPDRLLRRAEYLRTLPGSLQVAVARYIAGGR